MLPFFDDTWVQRLIKEIKTTDALIMASFVADNDEVFAALLDRFGAHRPFFCEVLVDKKHHGLRTCRSQALKLKRLKAAGAQVYLCKGRNGRGVMHRKEFVLDAKVLYEGSANASNAMSHNEDGMTRMTGHPVASFLANMRRVRDRGELLR